MAFPQPAPPPRKHGEGIFIGLRTAWPRPAGRGPENARLVTYVGLKSGLRKGARWKFGVIGARDRAPLKSGMVDSAQGTLTSLYRYPVKGLSPEPLTRAALDAGQTVPADRRYAIANGPLDFDPAHPKHFPKIRFLMLMRDERLAALHSRFDDSSNTLRIAYNNAEVARGDLSTAAGRTTIEDFFAANLTKELKGPPKILEAPGHSFSDVAAKVVSIINLASVSEIEGAVGLPVDPLRFRANLYVEGWPAWHELELMDKDIRIGDVRLRVTRNIVRCAATNVDPVTTERDMNIPKTLMDRFGHTHCGIYAEVIAGGEIAPGDRIEIP